MKKLRASFWASSLGILVFLGLSGCEKKETAQESHKAPQVFTPSDGEGAVQPDSALSPGGDLPAGTGEKAQPRTGPAKLPTPAELKTITPNQEAKRALTTDAMKADDMPLPEFGEYMKSRIPYYRGKGDLKFENDIVRIRITQTEMQIESQRGSLTFPMQ